MKILTELKMKKTIVKKIALLLFVFSGAAEADMDDYVSVPPLLTTTSDPMVMLLLSNDNQLWHKAYSDYSDLDGDGVLDTTYKNDFEYYGYFNSGFCYDYSSNVFSPNGKVDNPGVDHKCTSGAGEWSGNFMNWLTMTRIDVVRKVLYGGYRLTDTTSKTVLQRALVPEDSHAFAKVVDNALIDGGISDYTPISGQTVVTFCNVTDPADTSGGDNSRQLNVANNPPLLKIASGNYFTWGGSEIVQCNYVDEGGDSDFSPVRPALSSITGLSAVEMYVRVETCVSGQDESDCREYDNSGGSPIYKPAGLLQKHAEAGGLKIGLMTGSYEANDQGGVLRKNISYMGGDSVVARDIEVDSDTGQFINQASTDDGIINTLNRLRLQGWDYGSNTYSDCNTWGITISTFLTSPASDRECKDWGNPIAEMYLEALRYFGGETTATSAFDADDSGTISGLDKVTWADPMNAANACSNCAIVVLSTGLNNFDADALASASDLAGLSGTADVQSVTDKVGVYEGIAGNAYIVGNATSGGTNDVCDTKTVSNFSDVSGVCPELPSLQGTYNIAGLSYFGFTNDLRTSSPYTGTQNVETYTISLAETLPSFEIDTSSGESVSFVPYCRAEHSGVWNDCSLVDISMGSVSSNYGLMYVSWEDSLVGSDYDMDVYMVIEYCTATGSASAVQSACPSYTSDAWTGSFGFGGFAATPRPDWQAASTGDIQLRVSSPAAAAGVEIIFGFVMNGSSSDGTYQEITRPAGRTNFNSPALNGSDTNRTLWTSSTKKFTAVAGTPSLLQNPLWYAAKYGNFDDKNNNGYPDLTSEWDYYDTDGNVGADGIPDAYFPVSNPAYLEDKLGRILADITANVASGTAASVVASTGAGEGAVYQALYSPAYESGTDEIKWVGTLHGLFIDKYGELREDTVTADAGNGTAGLLTNYDPIVTIYYDEAAETTLVQRYTVNADGSRGVASGAPFDVSEIDPIWSARDQLATLSNYTSNRAYTAKANTGRYIFTGVDDPAARDGKIGDSEVISFEASSFDMTADENFRLLGFDSTATQAEVDALVNFIRGDESDTSFRSRSINWDGSTGDEPWLLGDIVNSSPTVMAGRPTAAYDIKYNDTTYKTFRRNMSGRRSVVFVGANDGMLHAFNAGYYSSTKDGYLTASGSNTEHPLGSELWAYVPYNILPHLNYLASKDYEHVYYVDGQPQLYEVNFGGENWRTILVVGMRFGGGEISFDLDMDDDSDAANDIALRGGYVIMDVTDPESPPTLLAEITHQDLGYAISEPTLVKARKKNPSNGSFVSPLQNEWYLVFGSGPAGSDATGRKAALDSAVSDKTAKVFAYNLLSDSLSVFDTSVSGAFIGGFTSADTNNDYVDDAVYFGIVGGDEATPTGQLMRADLTISGGISMSFSKVLDVTDQPFSAAPTFVRDRSGENWVFSGTGRFYTSGDNLSSTTQSYYGVKDAGSTVSVSSGLVDTSDIEVFANGDVRRVSSTTFALNTGETVDNIRDITNAVSDASGWQFDLPNAYERNTTRSAMSDESLVFTTYEPTGEACDSAGEGALYAVHFQTGLPGVYAPLSTDSSTTLSGSELVNSSISLGVGNPSAPTIYQDGRGKKRAIVQTSTGEIVNQQISGNANAGSRQSWREIPITW